MKDKLDLVEHLRGLHAQNVEEVKERAMRSPYLRTAVELVEHHGYTWEQSMTGLVLALESALNNTVNEYKRHLERCVQPPSIA